MSKDRFKVHFECLSCEKKGVASCVEEDGWAYVKGKQDTQVSGISSGFSVLYDEGGISFKCDGCGIVVMSL